MNVFRFKRFNYLLLVFITALMAMALLSYSSSSIPGDFSFSIDTYTSQNSRESTQLPHVKIASSAKNYLNGTLNHPRQKIEWAGKQIYAYIPKFEGNLVIKADGFVILTEQSPTYLGGSGFALFPMQLRSDGGLPVLEFSISEHSKRFVLLSEVFFGSAEDFASPMLQQKVTELLRIFVFGMNLTVVLVCIFLIFSGAEIHACISSLVMSLYFLISSINSLETFIIIPDRYVFAIILSSPILGANIYLFSESINVNGKPAAFWRVQTASILMALSFSIAAETLFAGFRLFPLTVVIISAFLIGSAVAVRSIALGWINENFNLFFFGLLLFLIEFSIAHDILVRFNWFGNNMYLISISRILFIFCCAYILSSYTLKASRKLTHVNANLKEALEKRTNELNEQFAEMQKMIDQKVIASEKRRLRDELDAELHDGVLSYMSVINIVSSNADSPEMVNINKLSRFALNEIRFIMATSEKNPVALLAAISVLRRQFIDRLSETGVDIRYDVIRLSECEEIDHKVVVECMRILQELVYNAAVRAESRSMEIIGEPLFSDSTGVSKNAGFRLVVRNSGGKTFDPAVSKGSGLKNIANRSKKIAAFFQIIPADGGAIATIIWPTPSSASTGSSPIASPGASNMPAMI